MNKIQFNFTHFLALFLFTFITIIYCHPIIKGKKINQSDYKQFLGMSKEIVDYRSETGKEALWTNSMFGGMPAYQISVHYPNNILVHVDKILQLYLPRPVGIIFLYFLGFYIFMLSLKIDPKISILGALAFGMSSYFFIILEAGHNTKAHAIAYMAPSVASMLYCFKQKRTGNWSQVGVFFFSFLALGLHLRANHLQITYYLLFILFFFWVYYLIKYIQSKDVLVFAKRTLLFMLSGCMAIAINLGSIWSTYDYSKYTIRGNSELKNDQGEFQKGLNKEYATAWSYGKIETFNMLYPNFVGGSSNAKLSENSYVYQSLIDNGFTKYDSRNFIKEVPLYFGPQSFTSGPVYVGAIVWLLFLLGLFLLKKPIKWVLVSLIIFSILLAWGKYAPFITNLWLDYFPLYNKFRTVSMILVIAQFAIPILGVFGLSHFVHADLPNYVKQQSVIRASLILVVLSLSFLLFGKLLFDFSSVVDASFPRWFVDALLQDRLAFFKADILRSLIFICLASSLMLYVLRYDKLKNKKWIYGLILLVVVDMWFVNKRYLNADDFVLKSKVELPFQKQDFDKFIHQDTSIFRVYNLNERLDLGARTSYFHHSLGGYHGAKLGKYQEVIDMYINAGNTNVLNMLNTKYMIIPDQSRQLMLQQNTEALGNAWFVDSVYWTDNANQEIEALEKFNPKTTAIINKKNYEDVNTSFYDSEGSIQLDSYAPNKLTYSIHANTSRLAVFSEIFYPKGWQAYIDGVSVNHFPVNYILRGLVIPKGAQEVIFEFKPKSFFVSAKIAFFSSCLLIITGFITFVRLFLFKK